MPRWRKYDSHDGGLPPRPTDRSGRLHHDLVNWTLRFFGEELDSPLRPKVEKQFRKLLQRGRKMRVRIVRELVPVPTPPPLRMKELRNR